MSRSSVEFFLSHSAENFAGEPLSVSLNSGIETFFAYEGSSTTFYRHLFQRTRVAINKEIARRPASTGIFFAQLQIF